MQLLYVILLTDTHVNANISNYTSIKLKRVNRSFLTVELFSEANAFESTSTLRITLNNIFGRTVPLVLYTVSKWLDGALVGIKSNTEERLLIYLRLLRKFYERHELSEDF